MDRDFRRGGQTLLPGNREHGFSLILGGVGDIKRMPAKTCGPWAARRSSPGLFCRIHGAEAGPPWSSRSILAKAARLTDVNAAGGGGGIEPV